MAVTSLRPTAGKWYNSTPFQTIWISFTDKWSPDGWLISHKSDASSMLGFQVEGGEILSSVNIGPGTGLLLSRECSSHVTLYFRTFVRTEAFCACETPRRADYWLGCSFRPVFNTFAQWLTRLHKFYHECNMTYKWLWSDVLTRIVYLAVYRYNRWPWPHQAWFWPAEGHVNITITCRFTTPFLYQIYHVLQYRHDPGKRRMESTRLNSHG